MDPKLGVVPGPNTDPFGGNNSDQGSYGPIGPSQGPAPQPAAGPVGQGPPGPTGPAGPTGPIGPAGSIPVALGGSGTSYPSIAAALAGETETTLTGLVPQGGTNTGKLVGPNTLSPVDDTFKDFYVVNQTTADTGSFMVCQWARVTKYVGATNTLFLDRPLNFNAEATFALINPIKIILLKDTVENVVITADVELSLGGHRITGKVDITGGNFCWIRGGGGYVTNGVQKTNFGVLKINNCRISARDDTEFALLLTNGNDHGRCEIENVEFGGAYVAQRGQMGWLVRQCTSYGAWSTSLGTVSRVPGRLMESPSGGTLVPVSLDVDIDSDFSGAIFAAKGNLDDTANGGTCQVSITGRIKIPVLPHNFTGGNNAANGPVQSAFTVFAIYAGTQTVNVTTIGASNTRSAINLVVDGPPDENNTGDANISSDASVVRILTLGGNSNYTGTATFSFIGSATNLDAQNIYSLTTRGISESALVNLNDGFLQGTLTFGVSGQTWVIDAGTSLFSLYKSGFGTTNTSSGGLGAAGAPTIASDTVVFGGIAVYGVSYYTEQGNNSTFTISGKLIAHGTRSFSVNNLNNMSQIGAGRALSWTGATFARSSQGNAVVNIQAPSAPDETWTLSGSFSLKLTGYQGFPGSAVGLVQTLGNTFTASGNWVVAYDPDISPGGNPFVGYFVYQCPNTNTQTFSGSLTVLNFTGYGTGTFTIIKNNGAGAYTVTHTGAMTFIDCTLVPTVLVQHQTPSTLNGPSTVEFSKCRFTSTFNTYNPAGGPTLTWTNATFLAKHCFFAGTVTINLDANNGANTPFASILFYYCHLDGTASNNSITNTFGVRPTTYQFWKCSFKGIEDAFLFPDVIDDFVIRPAAGTQTRGKIQTIGAPGTVSDFLAGTTMTDGIAIDTATVGQASRLMRSGKMYVNAKGTVVRGDSLIPDTAGTPTQTITGAPVIGKTIGRALEAAGASLANNAYTAVNIS